ncbi:MAG: GntR family transcriptional regulator [Chloroflexi bacterium]|nr:MAG: GntR family transcriptional regulator [Chloroflexota bacterium]
MLDIERVKKVLDTPTPAPLHVRLRTALQTQIMDGTLQAGEALPSERILQNQLEVSRATVRQAIQALIQMGFLQSVPGTGTFVLEQKQDGEPRGIITLITGAPTFHFFYPQLASALYTTLHNVGYTLTLDFYRDEADDLLVHVERLLSRRISGLAIVPPRYGNPQPLVNFLRSQDVPYVFLGRRATLPDKNGAVGDCVSTDNERIGYEATRHLLDLGHRHIVHLGFLDYSTGQDRAAGYIRAMQERGMTPRVVELSPYTQALNQSMPSSTLLAEPAYRAALDVWGTTPADRPTAVFCFNDNVAMGVYKALRDAGLNIPQDVSLVSVDNLPTIQHFEVPLTTFALPGEAIGRQAGVLFVRRLSGEEFPPQTYLLPATFIQRRSTAPLRDSSA